MKRCVLLLAISLTACTVGPDYREPDIATPGAYESAPVGGKADLSNWWVGFGDSELDRLIARALSDNLDLLTAASRVREAREQEIEAGAPGLPQVNASGTAAKIHSNSSLASKLGTTQSSSGGAPPPGSTNITLYSAGFDATWEVDIFGGVRRAVQAAKANTEAAQWQMRDGEVTLTAEVAADYIALRAAQILIGILRNEAKEQNGVLNLTDARARAGFVTRLDVNQQTALVATTQSQIPPLEAQANAMEHAIAVLLGEQPEALQTELDGEGALPPLPPSLPAGLPSDLLRRRPDIRAAERKLAASTAEVGVAVADLYPKFNLIAALSFSSNALGDLLSANNLSEIGLGSIMWPIFHGGEIHANIRAKQEERQQAYYAYKKAVLVAIQDVEDALSRYATEQRRYRALDKAAQTDASSYRLAMQQYRAGLVNYISVLTVEADLLSIRNQRAQSRAALSTDLVAVYKALGGGWRENPS